MPCRPCRFTQSDIARALRAAKQVGVPVTVEIALDGTIRLVPTEIKPDVEPGLEAKYRYFCNLRGGDQLGVDALQANEFLEAYEAAMTATAPQRKAGQLRKEMPKAKGGEHYHAIPTGTQKEPVPTLEQLKITKKQSSRWQRLADMSDDAFEAQYASGEALAAGGRREGK